MEGGALVGCHSGYRDTSEEGVVFEACQCEETCVEALSEWKCGYIMTSGLLWGSYDFVTWIIGLDCAWGIRCCITSLVYLVLPPRPTMFCFHALFCNRFLRQ